MLHAFTMRKASVIKNGKLMLRIRENISYPVKFLREIDLTKQPTHRQKASSYFAFFRKC